MIPAVTAAALLPMAGDGWAQSYPNKAITYVVAGSSGSASDVVGRLMADGLSKVLGQPVVVEDRPGGGGTVAGSFVADTAPDGYTILQLNLSLTSAETLYPDRSYKLMEDFAPITKFASSFYVFVVHPSVAATTFEQFIKLAKSKPGEIDYAAATAGTATHLVTELLKSKAGLDMVHIPYDGGGAATASVLAGETDFYGSPYATAKPLIEEGKLRPLAVTSAERAPDLPDIPAAAETFPGLEFTAWYGLAVPAGTPGEVIDKIYEAAREVMSDPEVRQRLADLGYSPVNEDPRQFGDFLRADIETIAELVKNIGLPQ